MFVALLALALSASNSVILTGAMTDDRRSLDGRLERATADLVYQSETDAPVRPYRVEGFDGDTLTAEALLESLGCDATTPVTTVEFDDFFADLVADQDWYGDDERAMAKRYRRLVRLLKRALKDLRVFKVGERDLDIYILGRTPAGEFAGVTTKAVET
jgi:hypothetical protein